jgi:dipeptide/tripeptide permease
VTPGVVHPGRMAEQRTGGWRAFFSRPMPDGELRVRGIGVLAALGLALLFQLLHQRFITQYLLFVSVGMTVLTLFRMYMSNKTEKKNSDQ